MCTIQCIYYIFAFSESKQAPENKDDKEAKSMFPRPYKHKAVLFETGAYWGVHCVKWQLKNKQAN